MAIEPLLQSGGGAAGEPLVRVEQLSVHFSRRTGAPFKSGSPVIRAVDGVSFDIAPGEALGLVGESGCGKTTVLRAMLRLIEPTGGRILFEGADITRASRAELRRLRRKMQIIFQDPAGSLDPRMRVGDIVGEPLLVHGISRGEDRRREVEILLDRCGLPRDSARRFPHEFSGGQRQRIGIARALALRPKLIACDEPTSALDVSIQSQILNLLTDLQAEFELALLFVSHDMAVVNHVCDRIAVMKAGTIVEIGPREQVAHSPHHEYTRRLLGAIPRPLRYTS
jgi:ABC-type glutathione transport system ATPase component